MKMLKYKISTIMPEILLTQPLPVRRSIEARSQGG